MDQKQVELPIILIENQPAFEDWLKNNAESSAGVWLRFAKKGTGIASVSYAEALESALCYGWIDSQAKSYDDKTWIQRFTPRGKRSIWSKINTEKAEQLIASGRMTPAGMKAIEIAKQNGNWDNAYEPQSATTLPEDFAAQLEQNSKAKAFFDTLNGQNRFAVLFRIKSAKKPETRANRIQQFIEMLEKGEKLYP